MENTEKFDFETVWKSIQETDKIVKGLAEEHKKTELAQQKTELAQQKTELAQQKTEHEIDRVSKLVDNLTKNIDGKGKSNGFVAETLISNTIENSPTLNGWKFNMITKDFQPNNMKIQISEQYDMLLENDDLIAIVEIKYNAKSSDIKDLVNKKIPNYKKLYPNENRNIVGIMACLTFNKYTLEFARKKGIYMISQAGESLKVENNEYKLF